MIRSPITWRNSATRIALILSQLLPGSIPSAHAGVELVSAMRSGETETVARLIDQSENVNASTAEGTTALHWAVHRDNLGIARKLVAAGADVSAANEYGVTALHLACTNRSNAMVKLLLDAEANPNAATWNGQSALMECARTGAVAAVIALLAKRAEPNAHENKKKQTALMWAAAEGHGDVTRLLVENGAEISARSDGGFTSLLFAARSGDVASARALLGAGADPNESTPGHGNSLVIAAAGGHEPLALLLLEAGADPNSADANGVTALHHSVARGFAALNGVRYDPAYRLLPNNMHALAKALLESDADPDASIVTSLRLGPDGSPFDMEGATAFMLAAVSADVDLMKLFGAHGADQKIVAKGGTTALMAAARAACTGACAFKGGNEANDEDIERAFQAVKTVVEMGIDVNAKNEDGQTAMHMAAFTGADPVVRFLAEHGAEINVIDNYGETPWSMASGISPVLRYRGLYGNHQSTAALLEELGANTTSRDAMDPNAPPPPGQ